MISQNVKHWRTYLDSDEYASRRVLLPLLACFSIFVYKSDTAIKLDRQSSKLILLGGFSRRQCRKSYRDPLLFLSYFAIHAIEFENLNIAVSKEEATHTFQTSCGLNIAMTMFFACISHLCPLSSSLSRFISRATVDRKLSFKHNDNGPSLFNCLLLLSISYEDTSADDRAIFHKRFYDLLLWIWNTYIFFKISMYVFIVRAM